MTEIPEDRVYARHDRLTGAVLKIGAGAVGSLMAPLFARMGVSPLWIVDREFLDVENVVRNYLGVDDLGKSKAQALADRIRREFPLCNAEGIDSDFLELPPEVQLQLVSRADVVVAATDELACQRRINEVCLEARRPAVYPGVWVDRQTRDAEVGEVLWVLPDQQTPCYECWVRFRRRSADAQAARGARVDIELVSVATAQVVAALLDPASPNSAILNPERTAIYTHGLTPTSRGIRGPFPARGLHSLEVRVPLPPEPCPACGQSQQGARTRRTTQRPAAAAPVPAMPTPPPPSPTAPSWPSPSPAPPSVPPAPPAVQQDDPDRWEEDWRGLRTSPAPPPVLPRRQPNLSPAAWAGLVAVLVGIVVLIVALHWVSGRLPSAGPATAAASSQPSAPVQAQSTAASQPPPEVAAQPVRLDSLPDAVPQVVSVTGTGDVPQGEHLWIFVYAPGTGRYFPQGKVDSPNPNPWTVSGVNVGASDTLDSGQTFTIYALVVDGSTSDEIDSFAGPNPNTGYSEDEWQATFAPFVVDSVQVQRA